MQREEVASRHEYENFIIHYIFIIVIFLSALQGGEKLAAITHV